MWFLNIIIEVWKDSNFLDTSKILLKKVRIRPQVYTIFHKLKCPFFNRVGSANLHNVGSGSAFLFFLLRVESGTRGLDPDHEGLPRWSSERPSRGQKRSGLLIFQISFCSEQEKKKILKKLVVEIHWEALYIINDKYRLGIP